MKNSSVKSSVIAAIVLMVAGISAAQADAVYGGIGFPGATIGYSHDFSDSMALRGEYSGGLSVNKSGTRNGVNFDGKLKAESLSVLGDWYPTATGFRLTGGVSLNNINAKLNSTGGASTIDGIAVDLTGLQYNVDATYSRVTPYVGFGYSSKPNSAKGWGLYADVGVTVGKFKTSVSQNVAGTNGVTQDNVDAQTVKVRESLNNLSALPKFSVGVNYRF